MSAEFRDHLIWCFHFALLRRFSLRSVGVFVAMSAASVAHICPIRAENSAAEGVGAAKAESVNPLSQYYGFSGVELYKLDGRVFNLQVGDFDQDGRTDVLVVDNRDSCLKLLSQQKSDAAAKTRSGDRVNDLGSDARFEIRQIPVDKQIAGMATADLNGDGRLDIAFVGVPDQLMVRFQPEKGHTDWNERWTVRLPGLKPAAWMIAAGDLNADQRADLVVLGESVTYIIYQNEQHELESAETLINTSAQLSMVQIADVNGDGRNDLCYLANEGSTRGLCVRLQSADGRLGPEICFDLQQPRSVTLQNVDQRPGQEIITIESRTGRVVVSSLQPAGSEHGSLPERLMQYGIGTGTSGRSRAVAVGDVDGDGDTDVLVADPEQAQVLLYRQTGADGLGTSEIFPSLLGTRDVSIADLTGDGVPDVLLLSEKEGLLATSRFADGRLTFPTSIAASPEGFELAAAEPLAGPGGMQIVVCLSRGTGKSNKLEFRRLVRAEDQTWTFQDERHEVNAALGTRGVDLVSMDLNADDRPDLLCVPNGTSEAGVQVLLQNADGSLQLVKAKSKLDLGISSAGSLFPHGSQLLLARDSFARAVTLSDSGWQVRDQFNAGETAAKLAGVAALDVDAEPGDEIVLIDTGVKKLRVLRKHDGLYRPWKEVELGNLSFVSSAVADLDGDTRPDLLLAGTQHFSVLYSGRRDPVLKELASYKLTREEAHPADVISGDINGDGIPDLTVIDTSINGLEILRFDGTGIESATHFRVFEEKRLVSESTARGTEPREGLCVDVTGDGRNDLLLLCHDRLIVYPQ